MKRKRRPIPGPKRPKMENVNAKGIQNNDDNFDLDRLAQERKDEKRRILLEKLRNQVKSIRDRRVAEVTHEPFPEGAFEILKLNDIWEHVLGYLTEPSDVTSAYFACRTFADILDGKRKLMMLPKALHAFKMRDGDVDWKSPRSSSWKIWRSTCLNIRGVSKAVKETADSQLFDSNNVQIDTLLTMDTILFHDPKSNFCTFEDEKSVDRAKSLFPNKKGQGHTSPSSCLFRNIYVGWDRDGDEDGKSLFYGKVLEFLQIHGASVQLFFFDWGSSTEILEAYEILLKMLKSMPNLKGLGLSAEGLDDADTSTMERFWRKLSEHPFPVLKSLEHLRCEWRDESLATQILRKCVNLKSVVYKGTFTEEMKEAVMKLTLEHFEAPSNFMTATSTIPLRNVWPLKHLTIHREIKISKLFQVINQFRGTLQNLRLLGCVPIHMDSDVRKRTARLDLPLLTFIHFRTAGLGGLEFDDIILLKALEKISVDYIELEDKNTKIKVQKYFNSRNLDGSNLWECFPHLMHLKVRWRNFYRPRPSSTPPPS